MQKDNGACASCRHQRKKCTESCTLAPYFPFAKNNEFQAVHKHFGVSNVIKILSGLDVGDRKRAVDSLVWEANCRQYDPVLGSFGVFSRVLEELDWYRHQYFCNNFQTRNNLSLLDNRRLSSSNNLALVPANSYPAYYNYESNQCSDSLRDDNSASVRNTEILNEDSNNSSAVILPQQYGTQNLENFNEESTSGSVILPQHYTMTGLNQPYFQLPAGTICMSILTSFFFVKRCDFECMVVKLANRNQLVLFSFYMQ